MGYVEKSDTGAESEADGGVCNDVVTLKGRIACEMNSCDELIASEMIFNNILEPLNPPEVAALLSAFIFQVCHVCVVCV